METFHFCSITQIRVYTGNDELERVKMRETTCWRCGISSRTYSIFNLWPGRTFLPLISYSLD